jgi:condensin complex subunit 3
MLPKLYISKHANADKLRALYETATLASEDKVVSDAPSRNALNKLQVTLGKIVAALGDDTVVIDDATVVPEDIAGSEEVDVDGEATEVEVEAGEDTKLISELLEDDDEDEI